MHNTLRITAICLLFFLSISALPGGAMFILAPDGSLLRMPIQQIEHTIFKNYLIPGLVLFFANGALSFLIAIAGMKKIKIFPSALMLQGVIVMIWIIVEIIVIKETQFLQLLYAVLGIVLTILGILLTKKTKAHNVR